MATVNEVRSGSFVYHDTFFVEVAPQKRHARASPSELKDLLLPKSSKSTVSPPKDQVAHFYEAQLVHYGLPRVKDKNAAKLKLINAVNSPGGLQVPKDVKDVEARLKKEWASVQRQAKKDATDVPHALEGIGGGRKRKASDTSNGASSTKLSFKVGDMSFEINHRGSTITPTSSKKAKKGDNDTPITAITPKPSKKKAATASKPFPTKLSQQKSLTSSPTKIANRPKQTAVTTPSAKSSKHTRPKQTARRGGSHSLTATNAHQSYNLNYREEDNDNDQPPTYSSHDFHASASKTYTNTNNTIQISGTYTIATVPHFCNAPSLSLNLSRAHDQLWGSFTIGSKEAIICVDGIADLHLGATHSFGWRSEDTGTGRLTFGRGCDGWLEFDRRGGVSGMFLRLDDGDDVKFDGQLDGERWIDEGQKEDVVDCLIEQWHDYPDRAYGRR